MTTSPPSELKKTLGTWHVGVAGVALVVASSTLVSDFSGFFSLGLGFAVALVLGFGINLLLALSASDLAAAFPRAGALYDYTKAIFKGRAGRLLAVFLGLSFFGMSAFAVSGEAVSGAFGLKALLNSGLSIEWFIVILSLLAVIPNLFGIRTTARVSAGLLIFMLGIRWFFGVAGFLGWSDMGAWSLENLVADVSVWDALTNSDIIVTGLALAFWSFVGIEFAGSLAEEVKRPARSIPRGMVLGLAVILGTSLIMGLGVTGSAPMSEWSAIAAGDAGFGGEAPQLAVGQAMFGKIGFALMALASVTATLGSLLVGYATLPRVLFSIAREGRAFGPLTAGMGRLHPRFKTPVLATLVTLVVFLIPALISSAVVDWVFTAAYLWIILYAVYHVLAQANRWLNPQHTGVLTGMWPSLVARVGLVATLATLYIAFNGSHGTYGPRALVVLAIALICAIAGSKRSVPHSEVEPRAVTSRVLTRAVPNAE